MLLKTTEYSNNVSILFQPLSTYLILQCLSVEFIVTNTWYRFSYRTEEEAPQPTIERRMTRLERARLEALKSFDGHGLHDVMSSSKKVVSRTLEAKRKKLEEDKKKQEKENVMEEETSAS